MRRIDSSYSFSNISILRWNRVQIRSSRFQPCQLKMREHPIKYILSKNVSWPSPPQGAMITCNCGRAPGHRYKEGTIFTNSLILGKLASFLHKTDIFSLKIAFSNYHSVENFLHNLSCKENSWDMHCDCRHRSMIVTIWQQKTKEIQKNYRKYKNITKKSKKIQKFTKRNTKLQSSLVRVSWTGFWGCDHFPAHHQFNYWSFHHNATFIDTTCKEDCHVLRIVIQITP